MSIYPIATDQHKINSAKLAEQQKREMTDNI